MIKQKNIFLVAAVILLGFANSLCFADLWNGGAGWTTDATGTYISGTLSTLLSEEYEGPLNGDGSLFGTGNWVNDTGISWRVDAIFVDGEIDRFRYSYTFIDPAPLWSHFVLETSDTFTAAELSDLSAADENWLGVDPVLSNGGEYVREYDEFDMPDPIYGFKVEMPEGEGDMPYTVTFYSRRVPEWGDIYLKAGPANGGSSAWNSNILVDWDPSTNPLGFGYLAVPDSYSVPLPGAVILGVLGLGVVGIKLRKFA